MTSPSAPARPVPGPKQPRERTAHGTSTTVATSAVSVTAPGPVAASPPFSPRPDAEQLAPREPAEGLEATPSQDLVPGGLGVLGLFILSAVVLWLWLRRRRGVEEQTGGAILGRKRLAPGVEVAVVRLGGRVWVLGRGADGDQLLSELDPVVSH